MNKDYLNKDFFISDDGKDLFEMQTSDKVQHLCVTDEAKEVDHINESNSSKNIDKLTKIVLGLGTDIPLWQQNVILKWKFNPSFDNYRNSDNVKNYIREILNEAISKWGDASPIRFEESSNYFDFEIIMRPDNCNAYGCTLASAFFPNSNQNILSLYPKMFKQSKFEQIETMIHEIGHIFGLRHYFAKEKETSWRSEIFGNHYPLTIMNYGHNSTLTEQDRIDLKKLYSLVWSGQIDNINGMPIQLFNSYT
ncbi:MAG: M12 family metallo-peptidase [Bacteroidota bacterium]